MVSSDPQPADSHSDETPPAFASWKGLYLAALLSALLVMLLIAAFSRWPF